MALVWHVCSLDLDSPRVVLWPGSGMFVWSVAICVNCFMGISYATIGLENQVVFTCF